MNHFLRGVARAVAESFDLAEPILEVGSYRVNGQEEIADLRPFFPGKDYLGVDMRPGPGVDQVADAEELPFEDGAFGAVLAMSTFEHVPRFWRAFDEVRRVLRPDGALFVSCPFYFHIHAHPNDYWRFTPQALHLMLHDYPQRIVGWHGPARRPANVWALAFGEQRAPISRQEFDRYRELLGLYAREPISWRRRIRYRLGRLLCGSRPFAPYLERDCWETECYSTLTATSSPNPPQRRTRRNPTDRSSEPASAPTT
jgi:SAM-dependent methyltransferase